jgi:hypothetical protein
LEEEDMEKQQDMVQSAADVAIAQIENEEAAAVNAPSPPEPVEEPVEDVVSCLRCGRDMAIEDEPAPSEEEKKEYLRCILGKKLYRKTYTLFDGTVTVAFELLTQAESTRMGPILHELNMTRSMQGLADSMNLKLLFYLRQFNTDEFSPPENLDNWKEEFNTRFGDYGEDVTALAARILMEYLRLAEMLPQAGLDENFWKGAGLT